MVLLDVYWFEELQCVVFQNVVFGIIISCIIFVWFYVFYGEMRKDDDDDDD